MSFPPSTTVLKSHHVLGYWGYGDRANLQAQLAGTAAMLGTGNPLQRQTSPDEVNLSQSSWSVVWIENAGGAEIELTADRLILGREAFGRSPLYWLQQGQVIWFASRLQWLLPLSDRAIHLPAVYGYACFSYVPTPLTPIANIFNLAAGTEQTWNLLPDGTLSQPRQTQGQEWQESLEQLKDEEAAIAQLQTLLQNAVHTQTADLADQPVGVFLSGGLDSSIVAALLVQAGLKVQAYTLNFGDPDLSEHWYAEQVAHFLNIPLHVVDVTPKRIRAALLPTAQALDLPFGDGVTVPLFLLAQAASQEVSVVFNGEGGDQLFAGWTNKPLIAAGVYQTEQPQAESFTQQYLRTFHRLWGYEEQVFQPEIYAQVQTFDPQQWLATALDSESCPSLLHRLRRATLMLKGAQNIHPRATNIGLAHGLDVRSPFCDLALAQAAFRISSQLHLQGSCEKYILKRAVADWLPSEIVWRTKRGMGVPLTRWCLDSLWHDLGKWLSPTRLRQEGIWQPAIACQIISGQLGTIQGRRMGECLWLLLMWQAWREVHHNCSSSVYSFDHPFWLPSWLGRSYLRLRKGIKQW
ncbi:MAG: asparagine synthase [Oscillatoriales cyanobacterium C42_A2020_001]|nr:asparagine synthase [Leptolyngbyaceae cyanobacterium C42_A2020_001]